MEETTARLDQLADTFKSAVLAQQRDGDPAHEGFYAWGWALSEATARVEDAGRVLRRQVSAYGDRRILRDDDGADPQERLREAAGHLDAMCSAAAAANEAARRYHSAIGHIAVEVDPEPAS